MTDTTYSYTRTRTYYRIKNYDVIERRYKSQYETLRKFGEAINKSLYSVNNILATLRRGGRVQETSLIAILGALNLDFKAVGAEAVVHQMHVQAHYSKPLFHKTQVTEPIQEELAFPDVPTDEPLPPVTFGHSVPTVKVTCNTLGAFQVRDPQQIKVLIEAVKSYIAGLTKSIEGDNNPSHARDAIEKRYTAEPLLDSLNDWLEAFYKGYSK